MRSLAAFLFLAIPLGAVAQWSGSLNLNATFLESRRDTTSILLFGEARSPISHGELQLKGRYVYKRDRFRGETHVSEDRTSLFGRYDFNLTSRTFGYASLGLDQDQVEYLNLRSNLGLGLGTFLYRSAEMASPGDRRWSVTGGFAWVNEDFSRGPDSSRVGLALGSNFAQVLGGRWTVAHDLQYIPTFDDFSQYLVVSDLQFRNALSPSWQLSVGYLLNYSSRPAPGAERSTSNLVLGLGYRF